MFHRIFILVTLCVYCKGNINAKDPVFRHDYKYVEEANGWFKLHLKPLVWPDAQLQCFYEGAVLVSPLNEQIKAGIAKYLQYKGVNPDVMFSGLSSSFSFGVYQSVEGVYLENMPVVLPKNEPSHLYGCMVFLPDGTMRSKDCFENHVFLCYKKYEKLTMNECGTVDNEYQLAKGTTKCYKNHPEDVQWDEAFKVCKAEGAWLSTLSDGRYHREGGTDKAAVGYKLINGIWWDVNGHRLDPNSKGTSNGYEKCGARNRDGSFVPINCEKKNSFVCEKKAV